MTIKLRGWLAAASTLLCLSFATAARADVTNNYCATFDAASGTLNVPSLIVNGVGYSVSLRLISAAPVTLQLTGVAASGLASTLGRSAFFNTANSTMSISCVVLNGTKFWAVFNVAIGANITATLTNVSSGVPANGVPLTQPPAGVTVDVVPTGEINGNIANATVTNNSGQQQCFVAEPGMGLRNSSPDAQSMAIVRTDLLCLANGAQGTMSLFGSCENAHLAVPNTLQRFTFFDDARADLRALTQEIERELSAGVPLIEFTMVFAIWVITDAEPVDASFEIYVRPLFQNAGLDPNAYPGLKSQDGSAKASSGSKADKLAQPR